MSNHIYTLNRHKPCYKYSIPSGDWEFFSSPPYPEWLWGPASLLSNEHRGILPRG